MGSCIFLPNLQIGLDIDALHPIEHRRIEIAGGAIVLGRVARSHDYPALGKAVHAEGLVLQELQHRRGKGFRNAVHLVKEQDALVDPARLPRAVHCRDDFAHGVIGDAVFPPIELLRGDEGQPQGALPRVMGDRVTDEVDALLLRDLGDYRRLAHTGRSEHDDRALHMEGDAEQTVPILGKVRPDRALDLLRCLFDVHRTTPCMLSATPSPSACESKTIWTAQGGTSWERCPSP